MSTLTPEGRQLARDLARRHGFGEEAVIHMLEAIARGHGRMAQFAHAEFGGSGQWMSGGMLMLGDMFDHALKARVAALCADLSGALDSVGPLTEGPVRSQSQSRGDAGSASGSWWPPELGTPSATGSQNAARYAYFADACRLAVNVGGEIRVHDTLDHRIGGFSQQQGGTEGFTMTSQHGKVELASLPLVHGDEQGKEAASRQDDPSRSSPRVVAPEATHAESAVPSVEDPSGRGSPSGSGAAAGLRGVAVGSAEGRDEDPVQLIERLGQLHERGVLTDEEFAAKKQELLARL